MKRRDFLQDSVLSASCSYLAPGLFTSTLHGKEKPVGPNEKVNIGIIGLGGRARDVVKTCLQIPEMQIKAVCDCYAPRCDKFVENLGKDQKWSTYTDFREMIDKEQLDGVMVETTTHARAWVTILAMQAGMDVYIEKPMSLTIEEGRYMVNAARRYKRVTQVGTQQRSMPINNWASDQVKNGAIGKVHTVLAPNFVGPDKWINKESQPLPDKENSQWWDIWTNQAELRPYHRDIHLGWMRWGDYDSGGLCYGVTGWGTHSYDQIQRALGTDETGPVEIVLEEPVTVMATGKYATEQGNLDTGVKYRKLSKPVIGPRAKVRMKYATGTELRLHLDGDRGPGLGAIFIGDKGKIEINRNKIASNPKEIANASDNPGPNQKPETQYHIENWIEGIKSRKRCNADIEYGQRSSTLCYLVNIVREVGQVGKILNWNPETERFTNCDEGNLLLSRPRRKGFEIPSLG